MPTAATSLAAMSSIRVVQPQPTFSARPRARSPFRSQIETSSTAGWVDRATAWFSPQIPAPITAIFTRFMTPPPIFLTIVPSQPVLAGGVEEPDAPGGKAEHDAVAGRRRRIGIAGRLDRRAAEIDVDVGHRSHRLDQEDGPRQLQLARRADDEVGRPDAEKQRLALADPGQALRGDCR